MIEEYGRYLNVRELKREILHRIEEISWEELAEIQKAAESRRRVAALKQSVQEMNND